MTVVEAKKLVAILLATFPSAKIEPSRDGQGKPVPGGGTAGAYERLLADLDPLAAAAAIDRVAASHRFPTILPSVADIREAALAVESGEVRAGGEAWGEILGLLRRGFSTWRPPTAKDVHDPVAWLCLQAIGWREICQSEETDPAPRAQFIRLYDSKAATARRTELSKALPAVRAFLEIHGDAARELALPPGTTDEQRRGANAWKTPASAGELARQLVKSMEDGDG